ncbi:glutamyl-tRNA reductase [Aeromicrobium senzhongii]|uniref:Glutamyl-tRNA reductase n=1 Tax=Aeromicrobium senzhongii TaxID=2663859 RepID=A0ABX6SVI7_9ACTN|nr:glutamyl-tRNA reductase [Aeromicrobium senzhongii]MTB88268.1 glutamyl-tRNA reductase [Aeromicrobium senzhongii]QNL94750.1 glutamyl-tRNA reductase [Aeromicrobium senzhongii]
MSVLVVGLSHKSAPVDLLEQVSLDTDATVKLSHQALEIPAITEAAVISTCNRVEVYVEAERFHGSVEDVAQLLADQSGLHRDALLPHIYVHYDQAAVAHLFRVAAGLDSMILGETQILGQVREALHRAQAESTMGAGLNALFQQALRIGKRGHAETGIDRLAPSIVTAALAAASDAVSAPQARFLVAGAGTMSRLAVRTLIEKGVEPSRIWVANRTFQRAVELVASHGVSAVRWESLDVELSGADVLLTCTGATGFVFDRERIARATPDGRDIAVIDLALPRDVAPDVRDLPNVSVVDIEVLAERAAADSVAEDVEQVRRIVQSEVDAFLAGRQQAKVTPTVVALRTMATEVVSAETARLQSRLGGLDEAQFDEVRRAMRRVAEKLIHQPTVRVKELVEGPENLTYADALAHLFRLDPAAVNAVTDPGGDAT